MRAILLVLNFFIMIVIWDDCIVDGFRYEIMMEGYFTMAFSVLVLKIHSYYFHGK